jgi:hypothetical protein
MEAICSSETSLDTQRTTGRYIPEYGTFLCQMSITEFGCGGYIQGSDGEGSHWPQSDLAYKIYNECFECETAYELGTSEEG